MFTGIEASVEDTHSPESIQESGPFMIQQASVDYADHGIYRFHFGSFRVHVNCYQ
ncbi:hypothetical protein DPMN_091903 [Dreissena polymorpha]|uniref:Uncharacterized protein n=1 Tax=Dreissena polymorpha TaxID=45954 RepID=A0A9D4L0D1_DREPO|nr:hypothetical protein DPMN_091903 [Dreissena polymorpha]